MANEFNWEDEWQDMPEYSNEDQKPFRTIYIHFRNQEDVNKFSEFMDQRIFPKQKSYWFPYKAKKEPIRYRYVDSEEKQIKYKWSRGGDVPGGHNCFYNEGKKPFITPMLECSSIKLRHSDVVVDIGAYVGTYSITCARFPVKKVIAYEPTATSFKVMELTPLPNLENVNAAILSTQEKETTLFISNGIGVTNSIVPSKAKIVRKTVKAVNYIEAVKNATVVKIDIEGGEYDLPILQPNVRAFIIDFHPIGKDWIQKAEKIIQELKSAGFKTVIEPKWENGWTRAGSWIRDIETHGEHEELMNGALCCGCGLSIEGTQKSLCVDCFELWSVKHREGYDRCVVKNES